MGGLTAEAQGQTLELGSLPAAFVNECPACQGPAAQTQLANLLQRMAPNAPSAPQLPPGTAQPPFDWTEQADRDFAKLRDASARPKGRAFFGAAANALGGRSTGWGSWTQIRSLLHPAAAAVGAFTTGWTIGTGLRALYVKASRAAPPLNGNVSGWSYATVNQGDLGLAVATSPLWWLTVPPGLYWQALSQQSFNTKFCAAPAGSGRAFLTTASPTNCPRNAAGQWVDTPQGMYVSLADLIANGRHVSPASEAPSGAPQIIPPPWPTNGRVLTNEDFASALKAMPSGEQADAGRYAQFLFDNARGMQTPDPTIEYGVSPDCYGVTAASCESRFQERGFMAFTASEHETEVDYAIEPEAVLETTPAAGEHGDESTRVQARTNPNYTAEALTKDEHPCDANGRGSDYVGRFAHLSKFERTTPAIEEVLALGYANPFPARDPTDPTKEYGAVLRWGHWNGSRGIGFAKIVAKHGWNQTARNFTADALLNIPVEDPSNLTADGKRKSNQDRWRYFGSHQYKGRGRIDCIWMVVVERFESRADRTRTTEPGPFGIVTAYGVSVADLATEAG